MPGWVREGAHDTAWDDTVVENTEGIKLLFSERERPRLRCGYCDRSSHPRSLTAAYTWWEAHDCYDQYAEAA